MENGEWAHFRSSIFHSPFSIFAVRSDMNLPNGLTVARIAATPLIAVLPFAPRPGARFAAFALFLAAAASDCVDGFLARRRKQETDLGRILDPLADKFLLIGMFVPMYWLAREMPFRTPFGSVGLPWWVVAIVLGREVTMTWFRQFASRRGVVIAAIWPAKWKTGIQLVWQGAAYFWFWVATLAVQQGWTGPTWRFIAQLTGSLAVSMMVIAIALTLYSLYLYLRDYGYLLRTRPVTNPGATGTPRV
jgi:CDP-diacylglycerol--glycerol-3-phosphate 3-phosphatidyltransferase